MNDFEEMLNEKSTDDIKRWLFKENVKIQLEKQELEELRENLLLEKKQISFQLEMLARKEELADKRMQANEKLLEEKQKILENGFKQLNLDKKAWERRRLEAENRADAEERYQVEQNTGLLFCGVNSMIALKKRYKDLLKIYHPDNNCGNERVVFAISKEYEILKNKYKGKAE